jgi:2-polyprenyl-3-methyl-5-hydroxy-6-metoxy-1,4-benzoquinol methylase
MTVRDLKVAVYRMLQKIRIAPGVWMLQNPLKIHEFSALVAHSGLERHHVILDLGCGKGFQTQVLARRCAKAIGVDIGEEQIETARWFARSSCVEGKIDFLCTRLEDATLADSSLDKVYSICVLEHIPNLPSVLAAILRLLKPGGELHVSVDSLRTVRDAQLIAKHKQDHDVVQYFTADSLTEQLQAAGLEVREVVPVLTSDFARGEFENRIRATTSYGYGILRRFRLYRKLVREEKRSRGTEGIWLVARARRPLGDRSFSHA